VDWMGIVRVHRESYPLTQENLLKRKIQNLDTWPYVPKGLIPEQKDSEPIPQREMGNITQHREREFAKIDNILTDFTQRQRTIASWLLAVALGIIGNLVVSLLFSPLVFDFSLWSNTRWFFLIIGLISIVILICAIFLYYPTNLYYRDVLIAPAKFPSSFEQVINALDKSKLSALAQVSATYEFALREKTVDFVHLVNLAIIRDDLESVNMQVLKVCDLTPISEFPIFTIIFGFRNKFSFWNPKTKDKLRADFQGIISALTYIKMKIGVRSIDLNENSWKERGHIFLNEITKWDMKELADKIESTIKSL